MERREQRGVVSGGVGREEEEAMMDEWREGEESEWGVDSGN